MLQDITIYTKINMSLLICDSGESVIQILRTAIMPDVCPLLQVTHQATHGSIKLDKHFTNLM
jgi:hypothetical protein